MTLGIRSKDSNQGLIDKLKELEGYLIPPFEVSTEERSDSWMQSVLEQLPNWGNGVYRMGFDAKFKLCSEADMDRIIDWDFTNKKEYARNIWDCEDFSMLFKVYVALKFGVNQAGLVIDYSSRHSYILLTFPNKKLKIFEPQDDRRFGIDERNENYYALKNAYVLDLKVKYAGKEGTVETEEVVGGFAHLRSNVCTVLHGCGCNRCPC